jgi:lysozyme
MKEVSGQFLETIEEMLVRHEGFRLKPYRCTSGKLTIGCGRNLEDNGISKAEAVLMLNNDVANAQKSLSGYSWYDGLSPVRKNVCLNMVFNLGLSGFNQFKGMISCLARGDYDAAADEMLNSKWAGQVGKRANELAEMMRNHDKI